MYYRKALRAAGIDPDSIRAAQESDEFILHIGSKELKGSVIGNPMKCAGAKACVKQMGATFAWVGATVAILGFPDGRVIRYHHDGKLPKNHDQGMFAVGDYKFKCAKDLLRPEARKQNKTIRPHHLSKGIRKGLIFRPESLAAQMRRGWQPTATLK